MNDVYAVDQHGNKTGIKAGVRVVCNGYPGVVEEVLAWSGNRMVNVRLAAGGVCVACDEVTAA